MLDIHPLYTHTYIHIYLGIYIYIYRRSIYIMTRLYLEAGVSIPKARATILNKLIVIDFWRRL